MAPLTTDDLGRHSSLSYANLDYVVFSIWSYEYQDDNLAWVMGVLHASNRFPHGISGGQRQDEGDRPMETFSGRVGAPDVNEKEGPGGERMSLLAFVPTKRRAIGTMRT